MPHPFLGHAAQLTSTIAWATGLMVQKALTGEANVASLLLCQFAFAAVLMWLGLGVAGGLPPLSRRSGIRLLWGVLAPGAALIFSVAGAARTDGVSLALIYGLIPLIGPVLAKLALKEALPWSFPLGATISLGGIYAISAGRIETGEADMIGNILVFCGVLCACASHVIGRRLNTAGVPWPETATLQVTGAAMATLVLAMVTGFDFPDWRAPTSVAAIAYLVVVMTILNFLAFNLALANIKAAWVSLYTALVPAIGAVAAAVLLGTPLSIGEIMGLAVITIGVGLPHLMRAREAARVKGPKDG